MSVNYDGRRFRPVVNSPNGQVNGETLFCYRQTADLLTATYTGGGIRQGQMIGRVSPDGDLEFCYQHVTDGGELRSGFCRSRPARVDDGRIRLEESWCWTYPEEGEGRSVVEEI